jgi:hypothetical protein
MFKAITLTKNINPLRKINHLYRPGLPITNTTVCYPFSDSKKELPRNKEEAWMMQEQERLKGNVEEDES